MPSSGRWPLALLIAFAAVFVALGIAPRYRQDWLLENLLVLVAVPLLVVTRRRLRFSNFTCGLLLMPAVRELMAARMPAQGLWHWLMPVLFVMSHSVIYELVEWAAAVVFGGDLGVAYLGTQGDEWDAQKDMALATAGAVCGLLLTELRGAAAARG